MLQPVKKERRVQQRAMQQKRPSAAMTHKLRQAARIGSNCASADKPIDGLIASLPLSSSSTSSSTVARTMSAPGPSTMKTLQKRLLTRAPVVPVATGSRVRSNSRTLYTQSLPFFDPTTPPPSSRPGNPSQNALSTTRMLVELHGSEGSHPNAEGSQPSNPPSSLALTTSPHTGISNQPSAPPLPSTSSYGYSCAPFYAGPAPRKETKAAVTPSNQPYHFDVAAYGIPKRQSRRKAPPSVEDSNLDLSVQVGEDAYFVRDNAMGVADGVGGWAKHGRHARSSAEPTPSALFARRLMHYCSDEVDHATTSQATSSSLSSLSSTAASTFWPWEELEQEYEVDEEEELADALDVLCILERAYDNTLKAHVTPPRNTQSTPTSSPPSSIPSRPNPLPPEPLLAGSSTALIAVLSPTPPQSNGATASPVPSINVNHPSLTTSTPSAATIQIAHLGDSLALLIRADSIVWRSTEQWFAFNAPFQLGPSSPHTPSSAQVTTLPVQEDDILILASDGLSDNMWDEEVLRIVQRVRRAFMPHPGASVLGRRALAGMLSEALCSRARGIATGEVRSAPSDSEDVFDTPFARRARENGRVFRGGKIDDISVVVAVISPADDTSSTATTTKSL